MLTVEEMSKVWTGGKMSVCRTYIEKILLKSRHSLPAAYHGHRTRKPYQVIRNRIA